jgi:hypothetical protein
MFGLMLAAALAAIMPGGRPARDEGAVALRFVPPAPRVRVRVNWLRAALRR